MVAGYSTPEDFYRNLVESFERLYREGLHSSRMMTVSLRLRISGHPSRAHQVRRFLEYARARPDVWFATRREIANWWLESK
jgi:peptidoglycan/xylan/chitin deacetylase (PgdA/CDA1 family)